MILLGNLIHSKKIQEVFLKRKNDIEFLFTPKNNPNYFLVKLLDNTFENRDSFRNEIENSLNEHLFIDRLPVIIDFLPQEIKKEDLISGHVAEVGI